MRTGRPLPLMMLALALALALAACGEQASSSSASAAPESAAASTEASQAPSAEASAESSDGDDDGAAALDCAALEALMPSSIGESSITTTCLSGEEIVQAGGSVPLDELEDSGVALEDAAVAIGSGSDGSSGVFMYSLPGADTDAFRDQMAAGLAQVLQGSFEGTTVGGKQVLRGEGTAGLPATYYLYVTDDLVVWVLAPHDDAAADVLEDLP